MVAYMRILSAYEPHETVGRGQLSLRGANAAVTRTLRFGASVKISLSSMWYQLIYRYTTLAVRIASRSEKPLDAALLRYYCCVHYYVHMSEADFLANL